MKPLPIIIALIAAVAIGIIVYVTKSDATPSTNTNTLNGNRNSQTQVPPIVATNSSLNSNTVATTPTTPANYTAYSASALAAAQASGGKTVLYFHADWCPICRPLDRSIQENLADLPANLTILKVNYDNETELKRTYGVTYQHTFVQIDSQGNKLRLWSGTTDAFAIADQLI